MELTHTKTGNYLIPNLVMDPQPEGEIGVWGWRRKRFLKEHRKGTYNALLMKGTLTQHLIDTNVYLLIDLCPVLCQNKIAKEVRGFLFPLLLIVL